MSDNSTELETLVNEFIATDEAATEAWVHEHIQALTPPFFERLKDACISASLESSQQAEQILRKMETAVAILNYDEHVQAYLDWTQGAYHFFTDKPDKAVDGMLEAYAYFGQTQHHGIQLKLLGNIIAFAIDCGRYEDVNNAFQIAQSKLGDIDENDPALTPLYLNYGYFLNHMNRYEEALLYHDKALKLAQLHDIQIMVAECQINQFLTLLFMGRANELIGKEAELRHNLAVAIEHNHNYIEAKINMHLGLVYTLQGQVANALEAFRLARNRFGELENITDRVTVMLWEAELLEKLGSLYEAFDIYQVAHADALEINLFYEIGQSLLRLATTARQLRRFEMAHQFLDKAIDFGMAQKRDEFLMKCQIELAYLQIIQKQPFVAINTLENTLDQNKLGVSLALEMTLALAYAYQSAFEFKNKENFKNKANQLFTQAIDIAERRKDVLLLRDALVGLTHLQIDDVEEKNNKTLDQALEIDAQLRQELTRQELKANFYEESSQVLSLKIQFAIKQQCPTNILVALWKIKGDILIDLLQFSHSTHPEFLENEIEAVRMELSALRWQVLHGDNLPEFTQQKIYQDIDQLTEKLHELRQQRKVDSSFPQWEESIENPLTILPHIQTELLLEFGIYDEKVICIVASRTGEITFEQLAELEAVQALYEELHLSFQDYLLSPQEARQDLSNEWLAEAKEILHALYNLLIPESVREREECSLLIAPSAMLHAIPFAALWSGDAFLVEQYDISMMPTAALLTLPHSNPPNSNLPLLIGASARHQLGAVQAELSSIQTYFPESHIFVDTPKTIEYLTDLQAPPQFLHFATHTELNVEIPLLSSLELTGEVLTIEHCYDLPLAGTEFVVLSSCSTNEGMDFGGSILSFQSAFMAAGANSVLSSLWAIDDQATSIWMQIFYRHIHAGSTPPQAVRQTQLELIHSPEHAHPAFWAAFACSNKLI
ncbi:MAG: CHAT domain-containing protein [Chloroflexota bacterium]